MSVHREVFVFPDMSVSARCLPADACPLFSGFAVRPNALKLSSCQTEVVNIYCFFKTGFLCVTSLAVLELAL